MNVVERVREGSGAPPGNDWERKCWKGAAGLRAERGRTRRRLKMVALVGGGFCFALLQVRLSTEAASRGSRITTLRSELKRMEVDLTVARSKLASRRIYSDLMGPAEEQGFGSGGKYRTITVATSAPKVKADLAGRVTSDLSRGARLILPVALAQDVWADGRGRARRP
jgi:hypothetical protein